MEEYTTKGTCSSKILFEIEDNKIASLNFVGGCRGNTQGVARLAVGRDIDEVIDLLGGVICRNGTSCPDQLACALKAYKAAHAGE
ncbi:MAG: TIGR03905 family TSCPD domain-containing protein [Clostridiales bacterium]|nr:TIGR03905 family TSCPD domain-containing protein [Clostridiales bacterium]